MKGEIARLSAGIIHAFNSIGTLTTFTSIQGGLTRFIAQFCLGGEFTSIKGLVHTHKCSTSFTHSFQPQAKLPMLQQKVNNEVHESQHTLTLPLDT